MMTRRDVLGALGVLAGSLGRAAERLPANKNVKWGLGSNLWNSFKGSKFTDILDVMRDTGFIGLRLTQFPKILETLRHRRDFPRGQLRANEDAGSNDPGHDHRIRDGEGADLEQGIRLERQMMLFRRGMRRLRAQSCGREPA